jgi:hypothetical protein
VAERGHAGEAGTRKLLEILRRWNLAVFRVAPPTSENCLLGRPGGDKEADNLCRTLEALGKAGIPFLSMPGINPGYRGMVQRVHRAALTMAGFEVAGMHARLAEKPPALVVDNAALFEHCVRLFEHLVPIAETCNGLSQRLPSRARTGRAVATFTLVHRALARLRPFRRSVPGPSFLLCRHSHSVAGSATGLYRCRGHRPTCRKPRDGGQNNG